MVYGRRRPLVETTSATPFPSTIMNSARTTLFWFLDDPYSRWHSSGTSMEFRSLEMAPEWRYSGAPNSSLGGVAGNTYNFTAITRNSASPINKPVPIQCQKEGNPTPNEWQKTSLQGVSPWQERHRTSTTRHPSLQWHYITGRSLKRHLDRRLNGVAVCVFFYLDILQEFESSPQTANYNHTFATLASKRYRTPTNQGPMAIPIVYCFNKCFGENGKLWYQLLDFFIFHYHLRHRNRIYVYHAFKTFLLSLIAGQETNLNPFFILLKMYGSSKAVEGTTFRLNSL